MKKGILTILFLMMTLSIFGCDKRSEEEKRIDSIYGTVKEKMREDGAIDKNVEKKIDNAYNKSKDAIKSIGDIFN